MSECWQGTGLDHIESCCDGSAKKDDCFDDEFTENLCCYCDADAAAKNLATVKRSDALLFKRGRGLKDCWAPLDSLECCRGDPVSTALATLLPKLNRRAVRLDGGQVREGR